jgi:surface antigen
MSEPFFNFQQGSISTPFYNHQGLSVYQDPFYSNPYNSSQLPVPVIDTFVQAINATKVFLSELSGNSQKDYIMGTAFGLYNQESANPILTDWAQNNFTGTPHIELVFGQNFNGAYAKDNDTIYLSGEFLAANSGNVEAVIGVLLEEVGHYLDSQINAVDATGDEGYIFSELVRGQSISPGELVLLKGENDHGVFVVDGVSVGIEKNDSLSTAENMGTLGYTCYVKSGWVGGNVPNDFYKFQINNPSKIILDLVNHLQSDVDLKLLDSNGDMIYSSAKDGTANEQISAQIGSGIYYIHVKAFSGSSNYNLGINAMQGRMNPDTDVDGDGKADIVGFGPDNVVHTSFSNGDGTFRQSIGSTPGFTKNYGWNTFNDSPRMVADVNGDGKADIIGFYSDRIFVSIGNGDGTFKAATSSTPGFTKNYGWNTFNDFPRMLADVNGDGKADIVGFGPDNVVHTSLSNGDGTFRNSIGSTPGFTKNYGWNTFNDSPRMLADISGDGKADIVGFYSDKIFVSIGNGNSTFKAATATTPGFTKNYGWTNFNEFPRMLGNQSLGGFASPSVPSNLDTEIIPKWSKDQQRNWLGINPNSSAYLSSGNKFVAANGSGGTSLWCTDYAYGRAIETGLFQNNQGIGKTVSLNAGSWDDQIGLSNVKYTPRVNSFIIFDGETGGTTDSRGHVGFVEQVYADGSFLISESNWGNYLGFGLRHLSAGTKAKFIYL